VREGQRVKQGEILAQIDDQVARLAAEAVQAQYEIARAKAANDVRQRFAKKSLEVRSTWNGSRCKRISSRRNRLSTSTKWRCWN
jgi:multidrug efflux pump subunit AcrA (membrane-fusion protein)